MVFLLVPGLRDNVLIIIHVLALKIADDTHGAMSATCHYNHGADLLARLEV